MAVNKREAQRVGLGLVGGLLAAAGGWLVAQATDPTQTAVLVVFGVFAVGCALFAWFWWKMNRHRLYGAKVGPGLTEVVAGGMKPRKENPSMPGWFMALNSGRRLPPSIEVITDGEVYAEECFCDKAKHVSGTPRRPNWNTLVYEFETDWIDSDAFFWIAVFAPTPISIVSVRAVSP